MRKVPIDPTSRKAADREAAKAKLTQVAQWLLHNEVTIGALAVAGDLDNLLDLILNGRASTILRRCQLCIRFIDFLNFDNFTKPLTITGQRLFKWLTAMEASKVGANAPLQALAALQWFNSVFELSWSPLSTQVIWVKARAWLNQQAKSPSRAPPFDLGMIRYLEEVVINEKAKFADRVLASRVRIMIGSFLRWDDLMGTLPSSLQWIAASDGSVRGLLGFAPVTKTKPRQWCCSVGSAAPELHNWAPIAVQLIQKSHGDHWDVDSYIGCRPTSNREAFEHAPSQHPLDIIHLRNLLAEAVRPDSTARFDSLEVSNIRLHCVKATMITLAQHLQLDTKTARLQGGWAPPKEENMAEVYLRESHELQLKLQETGLSAWREGTHVSSVRFIPLLTGVHQLEKAESFRESLSDVHDVESGIDDSDTEPVDGLEPPIFNLAIQHATKMLHAIDDSVSEVPGLHIECKRSTKMDIHIPIDVYVFERDKEDAYSSHAELCPTAPLAHATVCKS